MLEVLLAVAFGLTMLLVGHRSGKAAGLRLGKPQVMAQPGDTIVMGTGVANHTMVCTKIDHHYDYGLTVTAEFQDEVSYRRTHTIGGDR